MKTNNRYSKATKAMKAAWTNWKKGRYTSWSECLRSAWEWVKSLSDNIEIFVKDRYKMTYKAILVDGNWYPKSQIEINWSQLGDTDAYAVYSIEVPRWLYNKRNNRY